MRKKLPIGIENFKEFSSEDFYYVDKTLFIKELLQNWGKVNLFTRPRRFGKSLNMSMLKCFFEAGTDPALFNGLKIMQEKELCEKYMGKFPVISISLKSVDGLNYESASAALRTVIGNEAGRFRFLKEMPLEWLRFPIRDPELCACTFIRSGRIFVMMNSGIPMSKQIFAAAHELYHIRCFLEEDNPELIKRGSILKAATIDAGATEEEEMEANAFAGILLVPVDALEQQIRIYQINKEAIEMYDILTLMDIFAVPYKAMVLRLLEEKIISDDQARKMTAVPFSKVKKLIQMTGKAKRWDMIPSGYEKFGNLVENLTINTEQEALPKSRLDSDWKELERIKELYGIK